MTLTVNTFFLLISPVYPQGHFYCMYFKQDSTAYLLRSQISSTSCLWKETKIYVLADEAGLQQIFVFVWEAEKHLVLLFLLGENDVTLYSSSALHILVSA
ncbi:hypothetical protein AMECASPLE_036637 [Ameca splendens]|uniref:Uncharacterized protein n=1 Tax=Ameca splendens TaxID=208324 RepID=A0ABV0YUT6_9TELE